MSKWQDERAERNRQSLARLPGVGPVVALTYRATVDVPEPASDIDTAMVDSLKVLDPERPIREAEVAPTAIEVRL
jgi:hypothetical protein